MADYIVTSGELTTVADAIREKNGTNGSLSWPNGFVEGISSGGSSWQTVYEGSVTTEAGQDGVSVSALNVNITANTIKATFNGTEYTCNRQTYGIFGASFNDDLGEFDFTEYPFAIAYDNEVHIWDLITPSSGTYTLKIEEPQSGGSSDFSTAEVVVVTNGPVIHIPYLYDGEDSDSVLVSVGITDNGTYTVPMYKGACAGTIPSIGATVQVTGDAEWDSESQVITITGDCTITIS